MNAKPGRTCCAVTKVKKSTVLCNPKPTTAFVENHIKSHSVFKESRKQPKEFLAELPSILNTKVEDLSRNGPLMDNFDEKQIMKGENYLQMTKKSTSGNQVRGENGVPPNVPCDVLQDESSSVEKEDSTMAVLSFNGLLPRLAVENTFKINGRKPILAPLQFQQPPGNIANRQVILHHTSFATVPKDGNNIELEKPPAQILQVQPAFNNPVIDKVQFEELPRKQEPFLEADNSVSLFQTNCREEQNGAASYLPFLEEKQSMSDFVADAIPYCAKNKDYCHVCRKCVEKGSRLEVGATNWAVAGLLCSLGCYFGCCLIPFCIDSFKDEVEYCLECNPDFQ